MIDIRYFLNRQEAKKKAATEPPKAEKEEPRSSLKREEICRQPAEVAETPGWRDRASDTPYL